MPNKENLAGREIGELLVTEIHFQERVPGKRASIYWVCRCICGRLHPVRADILRAGRAASCGCRTSQLTVHPTHGRSGTVEYLTWQQMHARCNNPRNPKYKDYGGRGIKVDPRWGTFEQFYMDMGNRPSAQHSLDRFPNNDGDYSPGNCRWATVEEQANNTRSNIYLTLNGVTKTLAQWSRAQQLKRGTIRGRLSAGWTVEKALTTPVK